MDLQYVPLLQVARDLQAIPLGMDRFRAYLRVMMNQAGTAPDLPLGIMNPMGKEHVTKLLDALIAIDAEAIAAQALEEVRPELALMPGDYQVGLVIADDLKGGWTNRYATDYGVRFSDGMGQKYGWLVGVLWSSEPARENLVRETMLTMLYRMAYVHRHGPAQTLRAKMAQEGWVMAQAGCTTPTLEADDLEYTREVLEPTMDAQDPRTSIECLYGDAAGKTLGFSPRGLSDRAGLALALHDARIALEKRMPQNLCST